MKISDRAINLLHAADKVRNWPHLANMSKAINDELLELDAELGDAKPTDATRRLENVRQPSTVTSEARAIPSANAPIERKI